MSLSFKEVNGFFLMSVFNVIFIVLDATFFPNKHQMFDPDIFVYIFGFFGFFLLFFDKIKVQKVHFRSFVYMLLFLRILFIAIRSILILSHYYFDVVSDEPVWLRYILAFLNLGRLSNLDPYGSPPLLTYIGFACYFTFMKYLSNIWSEIVCSIIWTVVEVVVLWLIRGCAQLYQKTRSNGEDHDSAFDERLNYSLLLFAFSFFNILFLTVESFYDILPTVLGVAGFYFFLKERHGLSALFLTLGTLLKIYPGVWLFIVLVFLLRKRQFRLVFKYLVVACVTTFVAFEPLFALYGQNWLGGFFIFLDQFAGLNQIYISRLILAQTILFNAFFSPWFVFIVAAIAFPLIFVVVFFGKKGIGPNTFAFALCVILLFMPWLDQRYMIWVLPFICIDTLLSMKQFKAWLLILFFSTFLFVFFYQFNADFSYSLTLTNIGTSNNLFVVYVYMATGQLLLYVVVLIPIYLEVTRQFDIKIPLLLKRARVSAQ